MRRAWIAAAALAAGCATLPFGPPRVADCPGPILDAGDVPGGDFVLRERLRVRSAEVDAVYDLVVERRGERIVVAGLDALGVLAFSVEQQGRRVMARSHVGRALAYPAANALRDLHAARFARADSPPRAEVARPGCGYQAVFFRVDRRPIGGTMAP